MKVTNTYPEHTSEAEWELLAREMTELILQVRARKRAEQEAAVRQSGAL